MVSAIHYDSQEKEKKGSEPSDEQDLKTLVAMGYKPKEAKRCYFDAGRDINKALIMLMSASEARERAKTQLSGGSKGESKDADVTLVID